MGRITYNQFNIVESILKWGDKTNNIVVAIINLWYTKKMKKCSK